jgi:endoglucanase Acf2
MNYKSSLFLVLTFIITSCGGGGGGGGSSTPTPPTPPANNAPTFTNVGTIAVAENTTAIGTVTAADVDRDTLSYSLTGDDASLISIGSSTGELTFNTAPDFENPGSLSGDNNYSITVVASDGSATGSVGVVVSVTDVDENSAPVITSSNSFTAAENQTAIGTVTATDADGDSITFQVSGSELAITSAGVLTFVSAPDYETKSTYTETVTAFDGSLVGTQDITVTVTDVDENTSNLDVQIIDEGTVASIWGGESSLFFFDELNGYQSCKSDSCQSVDYSYVDSGSDRGDVLEVRYTSNAGHAGLVVGPSAGVNLSDYSEGSLSFDIKVVNKGTDNLPNGFLVKVESDTQNSGELPVNDISANGQWESIDFPVSALTQSGALNLSNITVPMVFFPSFQTGENLVYQIDNVRYTGIKEGATPPSGPNNGGGGGNTGEYQLLTFGAGTVSDTINPNSYRCVVDYGNWIYNAGVVEPGIASCNSSTGIPTGVPTKVNPQVVEPASSKKLATHRWWGSIPFLGEMKVDQDGAAAHITADPVRVRVSNKGARIMGLPGGHQVRGRYPQYDGPAPFAEVFDGIAVSNSQYSELNAFLKDYSDASVTVLWKSGSTEVMEATFVHGSPYAYFKVYSGSPVIKTKASDSAEKGTYYDYGNSLGIWTDVAGIKNYFLVTGEGTTEFSSKDSNQIGVSNTSNEFTITYLPTLSGVPSDNMSEYFETQARNVVSSVEIDYEVNDSTNEVTVSHSYLNANGAMVETIAGMHPLHWKFSDTSTSSYKIRSARGMIKFAQVNGFSYKIPSVGILPTLPAVTDSYDQSTLEQLVKDFVAQGETQWIYRENQKTVDTYWSGKAYGKVAEVAATARTIGLDSEANELISWLKSELEDWFTAETNGELDETRYFVYDDQWDTLLGMEEAYGSHQRLADHHFHYGYFVRAAAEICRVDKSWCSQEQYGPMIELLIRDYAADKDDDMFPPVRNFDPANGFSWADGRADALQGNNNESTSEAATSYGAIILYGLATGNDELVKKGTYLHASTSASYWQYWNNIDGYKNRGGDDDNFKSGYNLITTSIIWSAGADFSTWFSPKYAHILGIQGLPSSPLIFHVGLYDEYMEDYVKLGLEESSNGKPSGLGDDEWKDLWWNLWAMVDPQASINDYNSVNQNYSPEAGESRAHTYQWINVFNKFGTLKIGTGELTSNHPAAVAFEKNGVTTYVAYNYKNDPITVVYSDGKSLSVPANGFKIEN